MNSLKFMLFAIFPITLVAGCGGGNDAEVNSGGGTTGATDGATTQRACTGDDLKGNWRITLTVGPLSESEVVAFDGSESPGSNVIDATRDGITLKGTIDPSCNSASGTATDGSLNGDFTAVKIS